MSRRLFDKLHRKERLSYESLVPSQQIISRIRPHRGRKWTKSPDREIRSSRAAHASHSHHIHEANAALAEKKPECRGNSWREFEPVVPRNYSIEFGPSDPICGHVHLDGSLVRSLTAQRQPRTVSEVSSALISSGVVNLNASHQMDRQRPASRPTREHCVGGRCGGRRSRPSAPHPTKVAYFQ